jgi:hypothetical protein
MAEAALPAKAYGWSSENGRDVTVGEDDDGIASTAGSSATCDISQSHRAGPYRSAQVDGAATPGDRLETGRAAGPRLPGRLAEGRSAAETDRRPLTDEAAYVQDMVRRAATGSCSTSRLAWLLRAEPKPFSTLTAA